MKVVLPTQIVPALILALSLLVASAFPQAKIVGGTDAPSGAYPWMAALVDPNNPDAFQGQFCGGALIHPYWVVTAAHCVEDESASTVGVWVNIHDLDNTAGGVFRRVSAIFSHPSYRNDSSGNLHNDIALLLLDSPINSVTPVAYASSPYTATEGMVVRAIGWGDLDGVNPVYPNILQQVDLNVDSLSKARSDYGSQINFRHLAASAAGKDTCQGDSGGPLFDLDGDSGDPLLLGITSFGEGCADGHVGIYANVGNYKSWLDAFLAAPPNVDPEVFVTGRGGRNIANGTRGASRKKGTNFGGRFRGGRKKTRNFYFRNTAGTTPASVLSTSASTRHFSIRSAPTYVFGGTAGRIAVRFRAPKKRRTIRSTIRIASSDKNNPLYSFRVMAKSKRR